MPEQSTKGLKKELVLWSGFLLSLAVRLSQVDEAQRPICLTELGSVHLLPPDLRIGLLPHRNFLRFTYQVEVPFPVARFGVQHGSAAHAVSAIKAYQMPCDTRRRT